METLTLFEKLAIFGVPIIIAITFHEAAHGFVALMRGDQTAYRLGRVTLNPIKHIDPIGTLLIPGALLISGAPFLFGYAKPVPVNFGGLKNPRSDMVLVAAAGPATNFVLALISAALMHFSDMVPVEYQNHFMQMCFMSVFINVILGIFNLIPIPPLDGGRVAVGLLPRFLAMQLARLERYGFFIIIGLIFILPFVTQALLGTRISVFEKLILPPVEASVRFIFDFVGIQT